MRSAIFLCFFIFLLNPELYSQKIITPSVPFNVFAEYHFSPDSSSVIIAYRVKNKALIFARNGTQFEAKYRVLVEANDSVKGTFSREYFDGAVSVNTIEEAKSESSSQGLISLPLKGNEKKMTVLISDAVSGHDLRKLEYFLTRDKKSSKNNKLLELIPYSSGLDKYNILTNFDGIIPFSGNNIGLFLRFDNVLKDCKLIVSSKDTSLSFSQKKILPGSVSFKQVPEGIALISDTLAKNFAVYQFDSLSLRLFPGIYRVALLSDKDTLYAEENVLKVFWFDSPASLRNPESAVRLLSFMGVSPDSLMDLKKEHETGWSVVFKFWKKFDPTPGTTYNEVLNEFYTRADYAMENFASLKGFDGENTDRGKIYIKFGKPGKMESTVSASGKIVEHWIYLDGKEFYFMDLTGSGNFELIDE